MKTKIALAQITSGPKWEKNWEKVIQMTSEAKRKNAKFIAFPENFLLLTPSKKHYLSEAITPTSNSFLALQECIKKNRIWFLAGSLPVKARGKIANRSYLFRPDGRIAAHYTKIHLFDAVIQNDQSYQESKLFVPGKKLAVSNSSIGKCGLSICYDLRFPELYRKLINQKAEVLLIPSAFTVQTGKAHWDALTRARAIENQSYVVAPAQTGTHYKGRKTYGHSRLVDPWGNVTAEKKQGEGLIYGTIDSAFVKKVRSQLPALKNRKL